MEYWDIYDENKQPTGRTMKRNDWCLKDGEYHLTVLGVVARQDGTFLITKRVMTKAWAPGWWEVSGGAAQAGEDSYEAVLREVKEETGLDARNAEGGYLFTYKRENPGEGDNYFVDVYRFVMDIDEKDLTLQTEETDGHMFATLEQIQAFAAEEACERISEEQLQALKDCYDQFATACADGAVEQLLSGDTRFHEIIVKVADNEYVEDFSRILRHTGN